MKYKPIKINPKSWTNIDEKIFFFDFPEKNLDNNTPFGFIESFGGDKEDFTPKFRIVYNQQFNLWITFTVIVNTLHLGEEDKEVDIEFLGFLGKFKQDTVDAVFKELSLKKRKLKSLGIIYINPDEDNAHWMDCPFCKGLDDSCPHCCKGKISYCGINPECTSPPKVVKDSDI